MNPAHTVRIIAGQCKRSKLPVIDAPGLRPTSDRIRVTLFNWLGVDLSGWRCLDAFAGTGALGFEAASRGAADVVLLETQPKAWRSLQETQQRLKLGQVRVLRDEALSFMGRATPASFELVFLDPPFAQPELLQASLQVAVRLVVPGGLIYLESPDNDAPLSWPEGVVLHREARAGAVRFQLLQVTG